MSGSVTNALGVSKLLEYDVLAQPPNALSVSKVVEYAVLMPGATAATSAFFLM